ncbi:repressor (plasmid) [Deinococcus aetherius]|uniref:Repressor n=1 Tax=Deinococcus aetherius TaxID=200252 RepID=A0ABM8AKI8_9DEIO|nr:YafY family protein [Deinococcus aetherius]BDP44249.1 repressor [Deinococcus aetherius]
MYDPSMRVLTVLELLQAREQVTATDLAQALEVSVRTVQRYVARLQDLGIPVHSTRGPGATYRLRPGFRLPPLMFSLGEAFALALGLDALAYLELHDGNPDLPGARAKLERVLPPEVRERLRGTLAALAFDLPPAIPTPQAQVLTTLAQAVQARLAVRLVYAVWHADTATERVVEPLGLLRHDGHWFLAAYCRLRGAPRLFRVDRAREVEVTRDAFAADLELDVRAFVQERLTLAVSPWRVTAWVDLPPHEVLARWPHSTLLVSPEGMGSLVRLSGLHLDTAAALLLSLDVEVEVREPAELLEAFGRVAARARNVVHRMVKARTPSQTA